MGHKEHMASIKIAPSILTADLARLADEVRAVERAGADYLHLDVMDGHFVPPITFGALVVAAIRAITRLPLDVHLMIEHPERHLEDFARAGAHILNVHVEACDDLPAVLAQVRSLGCRARRRAGEPEPRFQPHACGFRGGRPVPGG